MTKSRIALIALAVCCIALLSAGTAAYFTIQATAYNVITTGKVDITIHEKTEDPDNPDKPVEELPDWEDKFDVLPGAKFSKIAFVENTGDQDLFARVRITKQITSEDGKELPTDILHLTMDTAGWIQKDGWFYYKDMLTPGMTTPPLLRSVYFDVKMDNKYQKATAVVLVEVQAVQAKNNADNVMDAVGWPAESK